MTPRSAAPVEDREAEHSLALLRVSYLSASYVPSLSANSVHVMKMCQAMVQEGIDVELFARGPASFEPDESLWLHYGIRDRFPIRRIKASTVLREVDYDLRAVLWTLRRRPALVYARTLRAAALVSTIGIPVIYEAHDLPSSRAATWYVGRMLRGRGLRKIVTVSDALKRALLRRFGPALTETRVAVAHDGVDLERFEALPTVREARSRLGLDPDGLVAGYAGQFYPGKGVELIPHLAGQCPDISFLVVGGDPESVEQRRREASQLRLRNLRYEGFVPNAELPLYLAASDILLLPCGSRIQGRGGGDISAWTSPMKMFEYMAAGRLIISSDLPVLREVLTESNSVLCKAEDVDAWRTALLRAAGDPSSRERLGKRARADAQHYTWRRRVQTTMLPLLNMQAAR